MYRTKQELRDEIDRLSGLNNKLEEENYRLKKNDQEQMTSLYKRLYWMRSELHKEKELNRQLTEEINSRAKFCCRDMLKEHERAVKENEKLKNDLRKLLATSSLAICRSKYLDDLWHCVIRIRKEWGLN